MSRQADLVSPSRSDQGFSVEVLDHRFLEVLSPEFKSRERFVAKLVHGYAGTYDFLAVFDGKMTLGDLKTGMAHFPESRLLLSGLSHAEFFVVEGDARKY